MRLDPLTLSFTLALIYLVAAFALLLMGRHIKVFSGITHWGIGALFVSLGFFFFFLRQMNQFEIFFIILTNIFQLIGFIFLYEGTHRFFVNKKRSSVFFILAVVFIPLIFYFTLVRESLEMRVLVFSIIFSAFYALIAMLFFKARMDQGRNAVIFIGSSMAFMSGILLLRFFIVLFTGMNLTFESGNLINSVIFIIGIVVTLFFAYGLALLVSQRLNEKLTGSMNHFKLIFDTIPEPITITEKDTGRLIDVNKGFVNVFGYQPDEVIGEIPLEIGYWKDEHQHSKFFRQIEKRGYCYNFETIFQNRQKEQIIALFSGVVFKNEGRDLLLSVAHVITDMRMAEEEALVLKSAVEQSPASILITDQKGLIKYVNPCFTQVTGYSLSEVFGENPRLLKSGSMSKLFYSEMWKTILAGNEWHGEFENRKKNGEIYWESASVTGIKNDIGEITHFIAVKEDITQRKIFDEELRIKNQQLNDLNAQKDRMFSIISHDLRGPFNGLLGLTNLICDDAQSMSKEEIVEIIAAIRKSAFNVFDLLNNLLDWSRNQQGLIPFRPEKMNVSEMFDDCFESIEGVAKNKDIKLNFSATDGIVCRADENMLKTVTRNLITNALKFTPRGGKVMLNVSEDNDFVKFSVVDNGVGMSNEILSKLFQIDKKINRLGTENEPSSGLGLIICYDFVKKHGGEIWVESKEGEGTTFYFTIPSIR